MPWLDSRNGGMQNKVTDDALRSAARNFIDRHHVMTLATSNGSSAWSAPVYYYFRGQTFYFFSSEKSRHILEGVDHPGADIGASIFEDQPLFDKIKGIQMSGRIERAGRSVTELKAVTGYVKRFKLKTGSPDILKFIETQYHAKLFCFIPDQILFLDNADGFGNRREIEL